MRILIADDDEDWRKELARDLRKLGHEAVQAADGYGAWEEFEKKPTRIVISDWRMPGLDGLELCEKIRSRPRISYAYFIMVTVLGDKEQHLKALEAGVDDFMVKPVDLEMLRARLNVAKRILTLEAEVERLQGIVPICAFCKRIRDDKGSYQAMEEFIEARSGATFSHGICAECAAKHYPAAKHLKNK